MARYNFIPETVDPDHLFTDIAQVGIVVRDLDKLMTQMERLFGAPRPEIVHAKPYHGFYRGKPAEYTADIAYYEQFNGIELEFIQPLTGESIWADHLKSNESALHQMAFLAGGETVVHLTGSGLGGRNQELALAAAAGISELHGAALFSVGSDGTDGPTDAAGGYVDGDTLQTLRAQGLDPFSALQNNDAYHALKAAAGLIITGPTGTNVNDIAVGLLRA